MYLKLFYWKSAFIILTLMPLHSVMANTENENFDYLELSLEELLNVEVISASLTKKNQRLSPSTISSITGDELIKMGARTLSDALKLLPGINISERRNGRNMVWIRGIPSGRNTKVMLLVDGVPHREPVFGGWSPDEEVPLTNIEHIEVIRGPGSALYGGNAYSGLISIFTRDRLKESASVSLLSGSFASKKLTMSAEKNISDGNILFAGSLFETEGHDMARDRQGQATDHNNQVYSYNGSLKLVLGDLKAGLSINNYSTEYPLYSINQTKPQDYQIISGYIDYSKTNWFSKVYTYNVDRKMDRRILDEQQTQSFQSFSSLNTQLLGATTRFNYQLDNHDFLFGGSVEALKVSEYSEIITLKNYQPVFQIQSVLDNNGDNSPQTTNYAFFMQDDLTFLDNKLALTTSLRYDKYQEFAAEWSPRIGLVYAPTNDWTFKGMWGTAFRPPSNLQQYEVRSDGNAPGNTNLSPEKIDTKEIALSYRISNNQNISTRYFNNSLSDFIQSINSQPYSNIAENRSVSGIEIEHTASFTPKIDSVSVIQLRSNFTKLNTNEASVAPNMMNVHAITEFYWGTLSLAANYVGRRNASIGYHSRVKVDEFKNKDNKGSYTTIDLNLIIAKPWNWPISLTFSAFNLLNKQYYNPTFSPDSYYDVTREPRYLSTSVEYFF